jgi:pantoate--beta-alanine ligase
METLRLPEQIQELAQAWKKEHRIGLVPTMGCLHEGHLSLVRAARSRCSRVILTIFVNPMQFGPNEDLDAYPRQFAHDAELAEKEGVDLLFTPEAAQMYGNNFQTAIDVTKLSCGMCGADRPGHFQGVATVVAKLFNLTLADIAVFGEKDFQQLAVIRQLTADLNFPVEIIGAPIVREPDGLAMSSRNKYLTGESRQKALCLYRAIMLAKSLVRDSGEGVDARDILKPVADEIQTTGVDLEYAVIVNEHTLRDEDVVTIHCRLAVAAKIDGKVRLIDNARLIDTTVLPR